MSSHPVEQSPWSPRSAGERVLMLLKMHGATSAADLGLRLGISGEAVRQQLQRLAEEGLVTASNVSAGVGRPTRIWALTDAARARFPDTHATLTVQLLEAVRTRLGDAALDQLIAGREAEIRAAYAEAVAPAPDLRARVATLVEIRSREGYMAAFTEEEDGSLLLVENHCPICAAAIACQGFCRSELDIFRAVLGPGVSIERRDHIVSGGRRCSYAISESPHVEPA